MSGDRKPREGEWEIATRTTVECTQDGLLLASLRLRCGAGRCIVTAPRALHRYGAAGAASSRRRGRCIVTAPRALDARGACAAGFPSPQESIPLSRALFRRERALSRRSRAADSRFVV
jgi:hypothetical protein